MTSTKFSITFLLTWHIKIIDLLIWCWTSGHMYIYIFFSSSVSDDYLFNHNNNNQCVVSVIHWKKERQKLNLDWLYFIYSRFDYFFFIIIIIFLVFCYFFFMSHMYMCSSFHLLHKSHWAMVEFFFLLHTNNERECILWLG